MAAIPPALLTLTAPVPRRAWGAPAPHASLTETAPAPDHTNTYLVATQVIDFDTGFNFITRSTPMFLTTPERGLYRSPVSITVTLDLAPPGQTVTWRIAGVVVATSTVASDSRSGPISLVVDNLGHGTHRIEATVAGKTVTRNFFLRKDPRAPIIDRVPDADPMITASTTATGVQRWVLQDLMPMGLGSWVMPANPVSMNPIPRVNAVQAQHTTSVDAGQYHLTEPEPPPQPWGFAGYCADQEFYNQLTAYGNLNRRFYLIDHRNRAWTVTFESVEMVPRKRQKLNDGSYNDWAADYKVTAIIYDQTPKVPS